LQTNRISATGWKICCEKLHIKLEVDQKKWCDRWTKARSL